MSDFLSFHLTDEFVDAYRDKPVDWGFPIGGGNSLSELTFITKYSRKKEDGTKERWWEVCRRCVEGMYSILKDHTAYQRTPWNEFKAQKSAQDAFDRMFHFKWTPPGRGMQHMGTRNIIEQRNMARLVNCLAGETEVVTRKGIFPIRELAGGTHTLLTTSGWVDAPVLSFGSQELYEIEIARSSVTKTIRATADHRWFVKDKRNSRPDNKFREVLTKDLISEVHQFKPIVARAIKLTHLSPVGVAAGFFIGDGSLTELDSYSNRVRLCGSKKQDLMPFFGAHRIQTISGSDDVFVLDCPNYFKDVPSLTETTSYLSGWVAGLFAADGNATNKGAAISSANLEFLEKVKSICSIIGIGVGPIQKTTHISNLTNKEATLYRLPIDRRTLTRDFFIRESHRNAFDQFVAKKGKRIENRWYVKSVTATGISEEVYCAVVEGVGNFALSDGLLTGNCSALSTEKISTHSAYRATMPFVRFMEMSMNGIGVGVDTSGAGNITLHQPKDEVEVFVVPDTREGWAASLGVLLESFFFKGRNSIEFDYSQIRPEGAPLHSFGGVASGKRPLQKLHEGVRNRLSGRDGELLTSRDIADVVNMAGKACTAGGTRRSATILFGDKSDEDYINLKNWNLPENEYRTGKDGFAWASNNSVLVKETDDLSDLIDLVAVNGEPGFLWVDMIQKYGRLADAPDYKDYRATLSNPCFSGDTLIAVADGRGAVSIRELAQSGNDVPVYSMNPTDGSVEIKWGRHPRITGHNREMVEIVLSDNTTLRVTPDHKFRVFNGELVITLKASDLLPKMRLPLFSSDEKVSLQVETSLQGDGFTASRKCEVCKKGFVLSFYQREIGVCSDRCALELEAQMWQTGIGFDRETIEVSSVREVEAEDVFNITVEDFHTVGVVTSREGSISCGVYAFNCGEIPLEGVSGEMCNLSEVYPTNHDTYEDFLRTLKHAYMYTKVVTLLTTPWAETNEVNLRNRRVGVSMTGLALFVETRGWSELTKWQDGGYKELKRLDGKYSEWLGVRESIRLTTVKPAGSTSLVTAVTPGVHWPTTSNYHLRRIRFLHSDPLVKLLEDVGYHVEPDLGDPDSTVVVTFPTEGVKIRSEREVSVWEKAALAVSSQRYWSDNMVSCTLSFLPHETKELAPLLASYSGQMKSASFLPIDESGTTYKQAPYEPIDAEEAQKWMVGIKHLDEVSLYGNSMSEFVEDKFCTTDSCEISFG